MAYGDGSLPAWSPTPARHNASNGAHSPLPSSSRLPSDPSSAQQQRQHRHDDAESGGGGGAALSSASAFPFAPHTSASLLQPSLSTRVKWCYGVGHVMNDLVASCWFSYLLVFLRTVLLFPSVHAGLLLLIGQLSDGAATPVVGFLSDRTLSAFGKRRLWIVVGSVVVLLSFPPIFHAPLLPLQSLTSRVLYYAACIVLFQFAWASVQVSHLALVPELTRDNDERVLLNSLRSICTILANLTVFLLAFAILHAKDTGALGPADLPAFFSLALMVVAIGALFSVVFVLGVPEPAPRAKKVGQRRVEWYHWFQRLSFYQTAVIYTCTRLMVNVSQTYMPLFLLVTLHASKSSIASVPLTVFGAGLASTCVCERLTRRLGSEGLTFLGCLIVLSSCVGVYLIPAGSLSYVYLIAFLLGTGTGIVGVSALSLICDLVGDCCESGAFVYGSMSFSDKVSNGAVIMLAEALTPMASCTGTGAQGSDGRACLAVTEEGERYYRLVMIAAPGGSAVLATLMLSFILLTKRMRRGSFSPSSSFSSSSSSSLLATPSSAAVQPSPCGGPCSPHDWDHTTASAMQGVRGVTVNSPATGRAEEGEEDWRLRDLHDGLTRGAGSSERTPLLSTSYQG